MDEKESNLFAPQQFENVVAILLFSLVDTHTHTSQVY